MVVRVGGRRVVVGVRPRREREGGLLGVALHGTWLGTMREVGIVRVEG